MSSEERKKGVKKSYRENKRQTIDRDGKRRREESSNRGREPKRKGTRSSEQRGKEGGSRGSQSVATRQETAAGLKRGGSHHEEREIPLSTTWHNPLKRSCQMQPGKYLLSPPLPIRTRLPFANPPGFCSFPSSSHENYPSSAGPETPSPPHPRPSFPSAKGPLKMHCVS